MNLRLSTLVLLLAAAAARAQIPSELAVPGRLPGASGVVDIELDLRSAASGGSLLDSEVTTTAVDAQGHFVVPFPIDDTADLARPGWLEVTVDSTLLSPRLQLHAAPVAMRAHRVEQVLPRILTVPLAATAALSGSRLKIALINFPGASATEPWVIRLDAGTYDLGSSSGINLPDHVSLQGDGRERTVLLGGHDLSGEGYVLQAGTGARVAGLTIRSTAPSGIRFRESALLDEVLVDVAGAPTAGVLHGVDVQTGGHLTMRRSEVRVAAGSGIEAIGVEVDDLTPGQDAIGGYSRSRIEVSAQTMLPARALDLDTATTTRELGLHRVELVVDNADGDAIALDVQGSTPVRVDHSRLEATGLGFSYAARSAGGRVLVSASTLVGTESEVGGAVCGTDNMAPTGAAASFGSCP